MDKCKTCRYWSEKNKKGLEGWGSCYRAEWYDDQYPPRKVHSDDAMLDAYASDDTGLHVDFLTGPDFGCVLHSQKEEAKA